MIGVVPGRGLAGWTAFIRKHTPQALMLIAAALLAVGCAVSHGVVGITGAGGGKVAAVNESNLYVTDLDGGNRSLVANNVIPSFSVSFNRLGNRVVYAANVEGTNRICIASLPAAEPGGTASCPVVVPEQAVLGALAFLPSGDFIVAYTPFTGDADLRVYDTSGNQSTSTLFQHFFLPGDAFRVNQRIGDEPGPPWYPTLDERTSLSWIVTNGQDVIRFDADLSGVTGPQTLSRRLATFERDELAARNNLDVTSGLLSNDGRHMAFRTNTDDVFSLWLLDLEAPIDNWQPLVRNAAFPVRFQFSPDGSEIVYESNADGGSVWLANADGSNRRKLADDASLPEWHSGE